MQATLAVGSVPSKRCDTEPLWGG